MSNINKSQQRTKRRRRIRARVFGTPDRPRLSVFRSGKHIYVQLIDDVKGHALAAANDKEIAFAAKNKSGSKSEKSSLSGKELAFEVGSLLAVKAGKKKIVKAVFDRGGYKYHGRVAALAEGARKGGLKF